MRKETLFLIRVIQVALVLVGLIAPLIVFWLPEQLDKRWRKFNHTNAFIGIVNTRLVQNELVIVFALDDAGHITECIFDSLICTGTQITCSDVSNCSRIVSIALGLPPIRESIPVDCSFVGDGLGEISQKPPVSLDLPSRISFCSSPVSGKHVVLAPDGTLWRARVSADDHVSGTAMLILSMVVSTSIGLLCAISIEAVLRKQMH